MGTCTRVSLGLAPRRLPGANFLPYVGITMLVIDDIYSLNGDRVTSVETKRDSVDLLAFKFLKIRYMYFSFEFGRRESFLIKRLRGDSP